MKFKFFALTFISIAPIIVFSQRSIESVYPCVVYIETPTIQTYLQDNIVYDIYLVNKKTKASKPLTVPQVGTGFFVKTELELFLVTAQHVAVTTNRNTVVKMATGKNNRVLNMKLGEVTGKNPVDASGLMWTFHPHADVAVIKIDVMNPLIDSITALSPDDIVKDLIAPGRGIELVIYGFPQGLGVGVDKISPISKLYRPASDLIILPRFDNKNADTFFLVDDSSIGGLSGGPVFILEQLSDQININLLLGLGGEKAVKEYMTEYLSKQKRGLIGLVHGTTMQDGIGYGAIVPSKFIAETVELAPKLNGVFSFRYSNGQIWSEVTCKDGKPWEVLSNFGPNGLPQEKGTLKNGNGTRLIYDANGRLTLIIHYQNGEPVKEEGLQK